MLPLALPILKGPLKGKRWLLATRINFFLGSYEPQQTAAFCSAVRPGAVVYDVGAHFGYYSLLGSQLAGTAGRVIALEPSPRNVRVLRKHIELNRADNITVLDIALSDHQGEGGFDNRAGSGVGHLSPEGPLTVKLTTLDALARQFPPPNVLKIDVEGAEEAVLRGGRDTLSTSKPTIFLSTHGPSIAENCSRMLRELGYSLHGWPGELVATP